MAMLRQQRKVASSCAPRDKGSLQFGVFSFGLLQDGDVRVGVFPEGEEILISSARMGLVACQGVRARQSQMRQCRDWGIPNNLAMLKDLMKFYGRFFSLARIQVRLPSNVHGNQTVSAEITQLIRNTLQRSQGARRVLSGEFNHASNRRQPIPLEHRVRWEPLVQLVGECLGASCIPRER